MWLNANQQIGKSSLPTILQTKGNIQDIRVQRVKYPYLKQVTELTNEFSPEGYRMGERQPKKWSTILVIREMQIKQT